MPEKKETTVYIHLAEGPVPAGILTTYPDGRNTISEFVYGNRYIERPDAVAVDPFMCPLPAPGRSETFQTPADFPVFNGLRDAAPDKWGRYLLDKKFPRLVLDEFDYLVASGHDRVGALAFGASPTSGPGMWNGNVFTPATERYPDLEQIQRAIEMAEEDPTDPEFRQFLEYGPSLGGARPKGTVSWQGKLHLAKFALSSDQFNICRAEFATMKLAENCGIEIPPVGITEVAGKQVYLAERFDRVDGVRVPFHSALTMTGSHESDYQRHSYEDIVQAITRYSSRPAADRQELYRRMVFNVFCTNSDDHMRNHGFLFHGVAGQWRLSPAYDVVPFPQTAETYRLALHIGDYGREASVPNLISAAGIFGLRPTEAEAVIEKVREGSRRWRDFFDAHGVSDEDLVRLASCFREL